MDVSPQAMVNAVLNTSTAQASQQVQTSVLKKALNIQAQSVLGLVQSVAPPPATGDLPLATSGTVGTQLNTRA